MGPASSDPEFSGCECSERIRIWDSPGASVENPLGGQYSEKSRCHTSMPAAIGELVATAILLFLPDSDLSMYA